MPRAANIFTAMADLPRRDRFDQSERRMVAALQHCLRLCPTLADELLRSWSGAPSSSPAEVLHEIPVDVDRDGAPSRRFVDFGLESKHAVVWVEVKWLSGPSGADQFATYAAALERHRSKEQGFRVLVRSAAAATTSGLVGQRTTVMTWEEVWTEISTWADGHGRPLVVGDLLQFLEQEGVQPIVPFTEGVLAALQQRTSAMTSLGALAADVNTNIKFATSGPATLSTPSLDFVAPQPLELSRGRSASLSWGVDDLSQAGSLFWAGISRFDGTATELQTLRSRLPVPPDAEEGTWVLYPSVDPTWLIRYLDPESVVRAKEGPEAALTSFVRDTFTCIESTLRCLGCQILAAPSDPGA